MQVILLEKIRNLGSLGDQVKVTPGYARNYLIPKGKAVYANKINIEKFAERRAELEKIAAEKLEKAVARQQVINNLPTITIGAKTGEEGKLFGSITSRDIVKAINAAGIDVEKRDIRMPEGTLRTTGEYEIIVELEGDVSATVKVNIVSEG